VVHPEHKPKEVIMHTTAPAERRFGVEIECGYAGGVPDLANKLRINKIPHQDVGHDGTCAEVRTRPLKGKQGFRSLKKLMEYLQSVGCYITTADGQHIHIEARDYAESADLRARLIESYAANRDHIVKFVDPYRRSYGSCTNLWAVNKKPHKERLDGVKKGEFYGRGDVNLSNLDLSDPYSHGTIEIRLHEGTLDFEKTQAWISFWIEFLDRVKGSRKPLKEYKTPDTLFQGVKVDPVVRAKLKAAAASYGTRTSLPGYH
jgi:Putative amidoligase enzyme